MFLKIETWSSRTDATDGWTDERTVRRMDKVSCRVACLQLEMWFDASQFLVTGILIGPRVDLSSTKIAHVGHGWFGRLHPTLNILNIRMNYLGKWYQIALIDESHNRLNMNVKKEKDPSHGQKKGKKGLAP